MSINKYLTLLALPVVFAASAQEQLAPITVRSEIDKQSSPLILAPGSFVKQEREEIKANTSNTLESAAGKTSNLEFTGGPRGQSQLPQIRGLNSQRILILEDGVRQNFQSGHNGRVFTDFSLIETVEVVKGPWSSLYGSGAMGGVMSFRRSTAADFLRRTGKEAGGEVSADGASANSSFGQRLTGFARFKWFEPLVSYRHSKAKDIRLGDGRTLDYSGGESQDMYSSLGFRIGENQDLNIKINRYEDKAVLPLDPENEASATNLVGDYNILKEDLVGDYKVASGTLIDFHARPYFRKTDIEKKRVTDGRVDKQIVETTGIDTWNNFRFNLGPDVKSVTTLGIDYFRDRNDGARNGGALATFPDGEGEQLGIYAQPSVTFNNFSLTPGVRHDSFKLTDSSGAVQSNSASSTSFKSYASYEYRPESLVFLGWGQAFNAPRLQDIYVSGMHFPGNFFVANPDLKPEKAETYEAGTKSRISISEDSLLSVSATYFRTEAKDFIARFVDIPGATTRFENIDRVRLEGYEAAVAWQRIMWGAGLSYGQVRSLDKNSGEPLTDTAADQWMANFALYPTEALTFGTHLRFTEKQKHAPVGTEQTPGYFVQDFSAGYTGKRLEGHLRLNNAFDRDYRRHASVIKDTGRDLRLTLTWKF